MGSEIEITRKMSNEDGINLEIKFSLGQPDLDPPRTLTYVLGLERVDHISDVLDMLHGVQDDVAAFLHPNQRLKLNVFTDWVTNAVESVFPNLPF